jgi:hypothetical protein
LFIDRKTKLASVAQALIDRHLLIGYSPPQASSVFEELHSHNNDRGIDKFRKADSISGYW